MKQLRNLNLSPKARIALIVWMALVAVAGIVTFVVLAITLSNRSDRLAEVDPTPTSQAEPQDVQPTAVPATLGPTLPPTAGPTPTIAPPATFGLLASGLELGGQVPGFIAHREVMVSAGMTWVKYQIKWNPTSDPTQAQELVTSGHANGFKVLLSISGELYPQETIDYASYIAYLTQVAAAKPDAIEVWNEMNLDREWPAGQVDPASYVTNMLAPAYAAIKAASPDTAVIIGALAPTGVNIGNDIWSDDRYVAGLATAGAAQYADCIGVHHNSGTTSPSMRSGRTEGDHYSWYYLPTVEVYYNGMNGALPVCITEFGYLTAEGIGLPLPEAFSWGASNTLAQQAQWLAEGVDIAQQLGYVRLVIVFNVDFSDLTRWQEGDPQPGYAILRLDGSCPACAALSAAISN